ncbi:hypothetical protein [Natronomonas marina]|jgi:hypothetical protein|uniref:hypothetical protein n=1 Tax=Natronomonas marina TaxID=2961939 RepID=UPI0020C9920A|nr:hypothetical protein [Natronomonas marina]
MKHHMLTARRGHATTTPTLGAILFVVAVFASTVLAWVAVATAPVLVAGLLAGGLLHRVARRGYATALRAATTTYRTVDRLFAERPPRLWAGE